ncbi:MAG: hypothetical protein HY902_20620 [Deltaproteobacteria bacterium]|nr:hypothetical protein [Deltaproteobacteria bacterium]
MRQTEREKWWATLPVGSDGLAAYCWLRWISADICGIVHCSPDQLQIALKWPHRSRAVRALQALFAESLIVWSAEAGLVYVRGWNQLEERLAPQQASHVKRRLADLAALPDCEARRVAETELLPWRKEFDKAESPELYIVEQFKARLPHAKQPEREERAPGSELRTALTAAWARKSDAEWWDRYLEVVGQLTGRGAKPLRIDSGTAKALESANAALPVTLPMLLKHPVAAFVRDKKEAYRGSAQAA